MEYHEIGKPFRYGSVNIVATAREQVGCTGCLFYNEVYRCLLKNGHADLLIPPIDPITMCESSVRPDKRNIIFICSLD